MVVIGIIWGLLLGSLATKTDHYQECKKIDFKDKTCEQYKK